MAAPKLQTIVVRLKMNHPGGKRNRAGFAFSEIPSKVEVTEEQFKLIENDPYLRIITKGTAFEQGLEKVAPKLSKKKVKKEEEKEKEKEEELDIVNEKWTKEEVLLFLKNKGLESGKDFNEEAELKSLIEFAKAL